jgi:hypothetical protein
MASGALALQRQFKRCDLFEISSSRILWRLALRLEDELAGARNLVLGDSLVLGVWNLMFPMTGTALAAQS